MGWEPGDWVLLSLLCDLRLIVLGSSQSSLTKTSGLFFNVDVTSILYRLDWSLNHLSECLKQTSNPSCLACFDLIDFLSKAEFCLRDELQELQCWTCHCPVAMQCSKQWHRKVWGRKDVKENNKPHASSELWASSGVQGTASCVFHSSFSFSITPGGREGDLKTCSYQPDPLHEPDSEEWVLVGKTESVSSAPDPVYYTFCY